MISVISLHVMMVFCFSGIYFQPLTNLKRMDLCNSNHLKELPDLSNAPNLEKLKLGGCQSLIELPPSNSNLGKLNYLCMISCTKLVVVPSNCTFASPNPIDIQISRLPIRYVSPSGKRSASSDYPFDFS